jgi:hypothetical protein
MYDVIMGIWNLLDSPAFRKIASVLVAILGLNWLGFAWILSSKTGLFKGLRGLGDSKKIVAVPTG